MNIKLKKDNTLKKDFKNAGFILGDSFGSPVIYRKPIKKDNWLIKWFRGQLCIDWVGVITREKDGEYFELDCHFKDFDELQCICEILNCNWDWEEEK